MGELINQIKQHLNMQGGEDVRPHAVERHPMRAHLLQNIYPKTLYLIVCPSQPFFERERELPNGRLPFHVLAFLLWCWLATGRLHRLTYLPQPVILIYFGANYKLIWERYIKHNILNFHQLHIHR